MCSEKTKHTGTKNIYKRIRKKPMRLERNHDERKRSLNKIKTRERERKIPEEKGKKRTYIFISYVSSVRHIEEKKEIFNISESHYNIFKQELILSIYSYFIELKFKKILFSQKPGQIKHLSIKTKYI